MGSSKRNLLTSILLLVVMGVFAVLTIFIVVDAINKKYYNDIKVEYEVQEESPNIILTFARNEGSKFSTDSTKVVLSEDNKKFRINGTVPTIEKGIVTNLDELTSSDGREFYFFSTNSSFIDPQEDPENPDFIFSKTDSRYYVSTEDNPIWYDVPKSSENLTLYSVFLTPNVHNSDFANAPLLNISPNVIISHDVVDIPYNAFSDILAYAQSQGQTGVAKIESVVIPNTVKSINFEYDIESQILGGAFLGCTTLTNIIIPSSVEDIGSDVFTLCSGLGTIEYENAYYIPTESNEHAILVDSNLKASQVKIHEECISIQGGAFSKYLFIAMGLITPPEPGDGSNIEVLGNYINMSLQEITIPKNVKSIGMGAFAMCSGLTNVEFGENSNLTSIGYGSFTACSRLKTINLEDTKLEEIEMSTLSITAIEEITLPSTLKTIGEGAFGYCDSLKTVNFENNSQLTSIGESAFANCGSLETVNFGENSMLTSIGSSAFYSCSSLETVTFGENSQLTSIGSYTFYGCSSLTSITIPDSVMSIGEWAFRDCSSLKTVTFGENSMLTNIGRYAFYNCSSLTSITIPESVTSIGERAFYDCSSLTSITIPESVTSIGSYAFRGCAGLTSITFEDMTNLTGMKIGNIFYGCDNINQLTIQSGEVKDLGFSVLSNLTTVILGDGVTSIGESAFEDCRSLETVNFGENPQLTSIGERAFSYCSSLSSITIPDSVTSIGSGAFSGCSSLTSITIPDGITSIEGSVFMYCNSLTSITIPDSVTSIGDSAFAYCSSLASITIPSSVTSIGNSAFWNCSSFTSITIPDSVTSIGNSAFSDCSSLETVTFEGESQLTSIGNYTFSYCSSLTSITIPDSVTSIGEYAFLICSSLKTVTFGDNPQFTSIGRYTFSDCSSLTSIIIPSSVTSIGDSVFEDCSSLETVNFGDNSQLTIIGTYAFRDCSSLKTIIFGDSSQLTSIGRSAFSNCSSLTSITIPDSVTSIGYSTFSGCSSLTSITIPESVTSIVDFAFWKCDNLTIYCEVESEPGGWDSDWNFSNRPVYWGLGVNWEYDEVTGEPVPIESGVEGVGYSDVGEDFGLGFREEIYFNDKRERKVV